MSSYIERLKGAVGDAVCTVADALDQATQYTFGTPPGTIGGLACNDPTPVPPPSPPFSGGQCEGVRYNVAFSFDQLGGGCDAITRGNSIKLGIFGPIRDIELRDTADRCGGPAGNEVWILHSDFDGNPDESRVLNASGAQSAYANPSIDSASRTDGKPDDCGDPPPPPPPPPGTQPINFTYINNEGDDIDVSGDVNIGIPILIAPFTLVAPITVDLGGISFDGSVQLSPDFDVTISPDFGGESGGDDDPVDPVEPDDDDPDDDEPDEPTQCRDKPIKGLIVSLSFGSDMRATEVIQDGNIASIGVPRVGTVYFEALVGNRKVRMAGMDLKSRTQYIPAPFNATVVCWRIHTEPGVTLRRVRPVFDIPV